jgi:hypothetical protein
MSTLALQDRVGGLHDNADVYDEGRKALGQLNTARDWSDWQKVGAALAAGRTEAMRRAKTNEPRGRAYNQAFGAVLKREQLGADRLDSATRNQLLRIQENLAAIEEWREKLEPTHRLKLNHPSAIWRHWQRTQQRGGKEQADVVEQSGAETKDAGTVSIIAALTTLIQQMRQRGFTKPKLNDLLSAKLGFDSNDLSELVALLGQLASELQEHANNSHKMMIEETSR